MILALLSPSWAAPLEPKVGTAGQRDQQARAFYAAWKKRYLRHGPKPHQAYIDVNADGHGEARAGGQAAKTMAVSEGQGYGLLLTAFMSDGDTQAHRDFDALFRYCQAHPSPQSPYLMSWNQTRGGRESQKRGLASSATDGDLDIAYALFLADRQWGSRGSIAYRAEGLKRLQAIWRYDYNPDNQLLGLGSFIDRDEPRLFYGVRSSDLMTGHFRSFYRVTGDARWLKLRTRSFDYLADLQKRFSPRAGLWPDFAIVHRTGAGWNSRPAPPKYLENPGDGAFGYNACRLPWRLAVDALCSREAGPARLLKRLDGWIIESSGGDPDKIRDGYSLDGHILKKKGSNSQAFVAPIALAALYSGDQGWVDDCYKQVTEESDLKDEDYYGNSIKALCLVAFSGRWQRLDARLAPLTP